MIKCPICKIEFESKEEIKNHFINEHKEYSHAFKTLGIFENADIFFKRMKQIGFDI